VPHGDDNPSTGAGPRGFALPPAAGAAAEFPLSYGQRALWFLDRLAPGNPAYVIAGAARVRGSLDAAALERAAGALVARHPALRTTFHESAGGPWQRISPAGRLDFHAVDLSASGGGGDPAQVSRTLSAVAFLPFDLARGPLLRLALFDLAGGERVLVLAVHHIVADFWSVGVLLRELGEIYGGALATSPCQLPAPPELDPASLAHREEERLATPEGERLWNFWRQALAGFPLVLDLPTDRPRPPLQTYRGAARSVHLAPSAVADLSRLARRRGATLYMGLLAGFSALLARLSGQERLVVGCPTTGRGAAELAGVVGYLVNPVAIPLDVSGAPTFGELLGRARDAARAAFAHQDYPFPLLAERLEADRDPSRSPVFQVLCVLQKGRRSGEDAIAATAAGEAGAALAFGPLRLESLALAEPGAQLDLSAVLAESPRGLTGRLVYNRDLFDGVTIERWAGCFVRLLATIAADPEHWLAAPVTELPLLGAAERHQLLCDWNDTEETTAGDCLHERIFAQAGRTPEAVAIVWEDARLSYGELVARAGRLAGRLREQGVGPEVRVGICAPRTPEMVIGMLATLAAGGAYVPLDPTYPEERRALMLEDSGAAVILTGANVPVSTEWLAEAKCTSQPANLAYLIYTSGSTGRPKAVAIAHASAVALVDWAAATFSREELAGVLAATSIGFDLSIFELFVPLALGGTVILADNALALPELSAAGAVTLVNTVPSAMAELVRARALPPSVRTVNLAGEPLPGSLARAVFAAGAGRLLNLYGPSEDTTYSTLFEVRPWETGEPAIGRPLAGGRAYVVERNLAPSPLGVPGEFLLGGAGLARGYLDRPELTAERFVPDPWSGRPGERLYRTGDLVRYRPDGDLAFLGRIDHQVKVRGFRIELGEIEAALRAEPGVREAVVAVRERPEGDRQLAAYVAGEGLSPAALQAGLARRLPAYMVPSLFALLPALPLSPNGKVDRRALAAIPALAAEGPTMADSPVPEGPVEELVAGIWREVLGVERVGREENFFALGGHSLLATRVVARLREALGVELPLSALFAAPTIAGLANIANIAGRVEAARSAESGRPAAAPIPRRQHPPESGAPPLSFAQERLWFIDQLEPGSPAYNLPGALRLTGALDLPVFAAALAAITGRHEALRTVFRAGPRGTPVQVVRPPSPPALPFVDLAALPASRRAAESLRLRIAEARRPFDLAAGPLLRAALLRVGADEHIALVTLHHAVADGWSMGVLVRELTALYTAFADRRPAPLPELPIQYADFAVWQRGALAGEALDRLLGYWRERLAGAPEVLALPTDRPRPRRQSFRGAHLPLALPAPLSAAVEALGRRAGTTPFMTLLAAWEALLARVTGQEDLAVGSPIAGRTRRELEGLIGFFVNTLVLRLDLSGKPSFAELLVRVREVTLGAYEHQDLPFERLVAELKPERHLDHAPLFQVLSVLQNAPLGTLHLPGVDVAPLPVESGIAKFDLTLAFHPAPDGAFRGGIEHRRDLFDASTAARLGAWYATLLAAAVADPARRLSELPLATPSELHQMLREWNDSTAEYPAAGLVPERIAARAARHPEALALALEGEWMTYGELWARVARTAAHLRRLGVAPEVLVGIAVERSFAMVVALLAIWEAGGAYLPLDPSLPAERLAFLLADAGAAVLLTQAGLAPRLPAFAGRTVMVEELAATPPPQETLSRAPLLPDHPAYVIYTSGSTGKPKGVVVSHRALANRMDYAERFELSAGARFVHKTTISFDASITELFGPLLVGGTTILARPGGERDPGYLVALLRDGEVPQASFTVAMLATLLKGQSLASCHNLRTMLTGGEAMPPGLPALFRAHSAADLYNRYGPTETTISVTSWRCRPGREPAEERVQPIGRPIANARLHLLDAALEPVPIGVTGELCVAGDGLARGYLARPALTAETFVPHPFPDPADRAGERLYRTGDLVRCRADGAIEFVGRIDGQVKIRGYRVELGEIEAALVAHPAVARAAVVDRPEPGTGSRRLLAYLVLSPGHAPEIEAIREHLRATLPAYMLPAALTVLPELPLSPTGKVDRKALPEPAELPEAAEREGPRGPVEELLAGIWSDLLGLRQVEREDSFFDLGGHSLLATQVVSRVRAAFRVELPLRALFEAPTLAGLAREIAALAGASGGDLPAVPPLRPLPRAGDPPLSFAQERLWFLDRLEPGSPAYNLTGAVRLSGHLDLPALAAGLGAIVGRHEALRTTFRLAGPTEAEMPVQVIAPAPPAGSFLLPVVSLAALPETVREATARRLAADEATRPFDLARGPLLRAWVIALGAAEEILVLNLHHIVADGWSMGVLVRELMEVYGALVAGVAGSSHRPPALPELPVQYADYAVWQRRWLAGAALTRQIDWWRERLAGAPEALDLPADRPRPAAVSRRGGSVPAAFPQDLGARLLRLAAEHGATTFMVLLAAFQAFLARLSGQERVVVGSPVANRHRREVEGLIGFFVNTLALPADLAGNPAFAALLEQVRETTLGAHAHQDLPFERLVEALAPERSLAGSPLFQVMLSFQHAPLPRIALPGLVAEAAGVENGTEKFDLTLALHERADGTLSGSLSYSADRFERVTAERLLAGFLALLDGAVADPERRIAELPLLSPAERHQLTREWNDTEATEAATELVHELFAAQARERPDAVAVGARGWQLTYGALAARARRLARRLQDLGVGPEARVAVCLGASPRRVEAVLAVLLAGGAYVPLDPAYPPERLAYAMADAGARAVLTERTLAARLPREAAALLCLDELPEILPERDPAPPAVGPESLAYVIYTSGSTGKPKGVELRHGGLGNLVRWHGERYRVGPADRATLVASPGFDAAVWELWPYLARGASVHLVEEEARLAPAALLRLWSDLGVTLSFLPTPLAEAVLEEVPRGERGLPLRFLLTGGDRLHRGPAAGAPFRLVNHYGPSEFSVVSTATEVAAEEVDGTPPIGRPIANTRVAVLGRWGEPVPAGVAGELQVAGAGLARGYLGRPDLTAERFVPASLSAAAGEPGARAYRTGDLARWLADGRLEFLGRVDHQVKIRGFRIELGEIEAVLQSHPAVAQAAVLVREDRPGDRRLVAYVAGTEEGRPPQGLLEHLAQRLPEHMVPAAIVPLPALPLTVNGKVDRAALARLAAPVGAEGDGQVAPRTPAEEVMAGVFSAVLGIPTGRIGIADSFFALGGHSLLAVRLLARVREAFGVELPVKAVFEAPTVAALAARAFGGERGTSGSGPAPPLVALPHPGALPLSFAQERLWFLDQLEPGSASYNIPVALSLTGALDLPALAASLSGIVRRHAALRTTFAAGPAGPMQVISEGLETFGGLALPLVSLAGLPEGERAAAARRLAGEEAARPFDLGRGPLLSALLLRLSPERHRLIVNLHHIVSDGWSMGILVRELGAIYGALVSGRAPVLPDLPVQYADYAVWQRSWLTGEVLAERIAWWKGRLAGFPEVLALPADRPRPPVQSLRGEAVPIAWAPALGEAVARLARERGATAFMVLLAAWGALLSRLSGQEKVAVGSPIANRAHREIEGLIGFFVNTLVLPVDLAGDPPFCTLLDQVRETALGAYAYQDVPFERLVEALAPERSLAWSPLFQVLFILQNAPLPRIALPGLVAEPEGLPSGTEKFDLTLTLLETAEGGLRGALSYSTDLFERSTAERLLAWFERLLAGAMAAMAAPERRASELPLLAAAERRQLLAWGEAPSLPSVAASCLHELVAAQAAETPAAEALVAGSERLTYGELRARAALLAAGLSGLGVGPEARVGVCLERGAALVVALLAVLEAGGAYVPLDPTYPAERLALMLGDSGARVLLTQAALGGRFPVAAEVRIVLLDPAGRSAEPLPTALSLPPGPDNLAYLIYTSGSTGRPKGVALTHRSAVALVRWAREVWSAAELSGVLFATSISFDLSVFELFVPLAAGGRVILADNALALPALPAAGLVTLVNTVPSAMAELVRQGGVPASVRTINLAGEALPQPLVDALYALGTVRRVWNLYGPSEDTTYSTFALQEPGKPPGIGRPVAGTRADVLDRSSRLSPPGVPGELHLGGAGLARCYFGRPELTAERFVPDSRSGLPGERLYRTGDLVRWRVGALEFLGRIDHQVKVRGFRIELGEIEAALAAHPAVGEAVVLVREDHPGDLRLVAYVTEKGAGEPVPDLPERLRAGLAERLPGYMVPAAFVVLSRLPLSANGKVDRKALPAPEWRGGSSVAPRNPIEEVLAGLWRELLKLDRVGVQDNFFHLGGHSLLATQLVARVRGSFQVDLPLRRLFGSPTIEALAALVVAGETKPGQSEKIARVLLRMKNRPLPTLGIEAQPGRSRRGVQPLQALGDRAQHAERRPLVGEGVAQEEEGG
jgi:amino acid adenylation domain-containing protein